MLGGEHIMWSPQRFGKYPTSATLRENNIEAERFKAIFFIHRSEENWYRSLLEDLEKGTYKVREEHPKTVVVACELPIHTSSQTGPYARQRGLIYHFERDSGRSNFMFKKNGGWDDCGRREEYRDNTTCTAFTPGKMASQMKEYAVTPAKNAEIIVINAINMQGRIFNKLEPRCYEKDRE